jgi:hypothetical protein
MGNSPSRDDRRCTAGLLKVKANGLMVWIDVPDLFEEGRESIDRCPSERSLVGVENLSDATCVGRPHRYVNEPSVQVRYWNKSIQLSIDVRYFLTNNAGVAGVLTAQDANTVVTEKGHTI